MLAHEVAGMRETAPPGPAERPFSDGGAHCQVPRPLVENFIFLSGKQERWSRSLLSVSHREGVRNV